VTAEGICRTDGAPSVWSDAKGNLSLLVDTSIFSLDAILRAAYKFTGTCYVWVEQSHVASRHLVCLRPKQSHTDLAALAGNFSNELIDQQLRAQLEQQFGDLRTIIAAQAFSEGNLLGPQTDPR
jgi:His-Xaa-Ser system protein HxsD